MSFSACKISSVEPLCVDTREAPPVTRFSSAVDRVSDGSESLFFITEELSKTGAGASPHTQRQTTTR
jgi:hypothetical protein